MILAAASAAYDGAAGVYEMPSWMKSLDVTLAAVLGLLFIVACIVVAVRSWKALARRGGVHPALVVVPGFLVGIVLSLGLARIAGDLLFLLLWFAWTINR